MPAGPVCPGRKSMPAQATQSAGLGKPEQPSIEGRNRLQVKAGSRSFFKRKGKAGELPAPFAEIGFVPDQDQAGIIGDAGQGTEEGFKIAAAQEILLLHGWHMNMPGDDFGSLHRSQKRARPDGQTVFSV